MACRVARLSQDLLRIDLAFCCACVSADLEGGQPKGGKMITGEVLRVKYGNYFVKGQDGKEVRLHTDQTTQMLGQIRKGDRIEAKVNDQNHALAIREAQ